MQVPFCSRTQFRYSLDGVTLVDKVGWVEDVNHYE